MGGDVAGARDDGLDVVNLMHGREDVPALEVGHRAIAVGGVYHHSKQGRHRILDLGGRG